jgi:hypothetical protein
MQVQKWGRTLESLNSSTEKDKLLKQFLKPLIDTVITAIELVLKHSFIGKQELNDFCYRPRAPSIKTNLNSSLREIGQVLYVYLVQNPQFYNNIVIK